MNKSLSLSAVVFWLLAFVASFTWLPAYETQFFMVSLAALFTAMALNDGAGIASRQWKFPTAPVLIAGLCFWAVAGVSVLMSDVLFVSWIYFFFFSVLPLTIVFFLVGDNFETRLKWAWHGIKILLAVLALYTLYQYFFRQGAIMSGRVHEPFADPNGLAATLSLGIFLLAGKIIKGDIRMSRLDKRLAIFDVALFFMLLMAFLATGSRGALLAFVIGALLFAFSCGFRHISKNTWKVFLGAGILACAIIGFIFKPTVPMVEGSLFKVMFYRVIWQGGWSNLLDERMVIWNSAIEILKSHPWFGVGTGNFSNYYAEVRNAGDTTAGYMVHNDPLQYAVEMGFAGVVLFYSICALVVGRTVKALRNLAKGDNRRIDIIAPFFGLSALVLHSHVTFNFHSLPCLFFAGFAFSAWYLATSAPMNETLRVVKAPSLLNAQALQVLFLVVAFAMTVLSTAPLYSQILVKQADRALKNDELELFAQKLDRANAVALGLNSQAYILAADIPLSIVNQASPTLSSSDRAQFLLQAEKLLARGIKANPRETDIMVLQARLSAFKGDAQAQEDYLRRAAKLDPWNLAAKRALAEYLEKTGRLEEAVGLMLSGIDLKYSPAHAQNYMSYYLQAKTMEARLKDGAGR